MRDNFTCVINLFDTNHQNATYEKFRRYSRNVELSQVFPNLDSLDRKVKY